MAHNSVNGKSLFLSSTCLLRHWFNSSEGTLHVAAATIKKLECLISPYCVRRMENIVLMSWLFCTCSYSENAREFLDTHLALSQQFASSLPNEFYG